MDSRKVSSQKGNTPAWKLVIAGFWITGFLWYFFDQPLTSSDLRRSDLWLMMADAVLAPGESVVSRHEAGPPSGIRFLPQRFPIFAWALAIVSLAGLHGFAILKSLRLPVALFRSEQVVLCFGMGLSALSLITLCCGLAGQLNLIAITSPSVISIVLLACRLTTSRETPPEHMGSRQSAADSRYLPWVFLPVIVPCCAYLLLGAATPPFDFDVREYHLQGPKEWFEQGQITFLRHNVYTSFPFLSEMLSLTGMTFTGDWWSGALAGQVVLACFQLLSVLAVFAVGKRWFSNSVAWLASLIYLTTPWTLRISLIAYAEGALTFFLISSTMASLWFRIAPNGQGRLAIICGILAGSAMASKYTGLISVIMPTAVVIAVGAASVRRTSPEHDRSKTRSLSQWSHVLSVWALYASGITLAVSPWLMRNLYDTGNPVYPLGYSIFGGEEWSPEIDARWKPAHGPAEHRLTEIPRHFLDAAVRNTWTSALLFALSLPGILLWRRNRILPILLSLTGWGFFTWWALTHRIDRFWIPVIPLLSILAACSWLLSNSRVWRSFLGSVILLVTVFNIRFCQLPALVGFHAGLMDLDAARQLPVRTDIQRLNTTLPNGSKVLMVGEAEVFDATFPLLYNTVFDDSLFEEMTSNPNEMDLPGRQRRMRSAAEIRSVFRSAGITHVLVHWGEILRYRLPGSYGYTEYVQPARFQSLVAAGVLHPPQTLLQRSWSSLPDREREIILTWDGAEYLIQQPDAVAIVQLFSVAGAVDEPNQP